MTEEKLITQTENSVTLEFSVPDTSPYFDGHFPDFPILPAVAQVDLILRFASRYLGTGSGLSELRRIKFSSLIRPFTPLRLNIERNGEIISFKMTSIDDGAIVYSQGTVRAA